MVGLTLLPDPFQSLPHGLGGWDVRLGESVQAAAHCSGQSGEFERCCQGAHSPGQQDPAQIVRMGQGVSLRLECMASGGRVAWGIKNLVEGLFLDRRGATGPGGDSVEVRPRLNEK